MRLNLTLRCISKALRDSEGNLTITWVRRSRINGGWQDNTDIPLAEEQESYEVEIMNGLEVVRVLYSTVAAVSYSGAEQSEDFGDIQENVTVKVYQLSALVGRGRAGIAEI